jgi:putative NADPH-quinone reductase
MKNILIINGNPNKESLNAAMAWSYFEGANQSSKNVELIHLSDLEFDPNMHNGYNVKQELEYDIKLMQGKIKQADHIVWVFPHWWGSVPAILKGFIDRTFLPDFAFKYSVGSPIPKKLLRGKSSRMIITMDTPPFIYKFFFGAPVFNMMKKRVLKFSGFNPVKITTFGPVRTSKEKVRSNWIEKVYHLGVNLR